MAHITFSVFKFKSKFFYCLKYSEFVGDQCSSFVSKRYQDIIYVTENTGFN